MVNEKLKNAIHADVQKEAKRKRAIRGEIKPGYEFEALCAVAHDVNKCLWRKPYIIISNEGIEDLPGFEQEITESVRNWIEVYQGDERLTRLLELDRRTQRWLKAKLGGLWDDAIAIAKDTLPIPAVLDNAIKIAVCENIIEKIEGSEKFEDFFDDGPDVQTVWNLFFEQYEQFSSDTRFKKARNKAIAEIRKAVEHLPELLDKLTVREKRGWPPKWITGNKSIMQNLTRKGNRHFLQLYQIFVDSRIRLGGRGIEDGEPVLVKPDYSKIQKATGLQPQQVRRYTSEMVWHRILKIIKHHGRSGQAVHSVGEWVKGKGRFPRPVYYLKNTPTMREALRSFDVNKRLKVKK